PSFPTRRSSDLPQSDPKGGPNHAKASNRPPNAKNVRLDFKTRQECLRAPRCPPSQSRAARDAKSLSPLHSDPHCQTTKPRNRPRPAPEFHVPGMNDATGQLSGIGYQKLFRSPSSDPCPLKRAKRAGGGGRDRTDDLVLAKHALS